MLLGSASEQRDKAIARFFEKLTEIAEAVLPLVKKAIEEQAKHAQTR